MGQPIDGVHIRIADDGEILAKGPNVVEWSGRDAVLNQERVRSRFAQVVEEKTRG